MKRILTNAVLSIIVLLLLYFIMVVIPGCSTQKHIQKESTTIDSTSIRNLIEVIRIKDILIAKYEQDIRELQFGSVTFNPDPCDSTFIERLVSTGCDPLILDSLLKEHYKLRNEVKILANGTIIAKGDIKSANVTKEKLTKTISSLQHDRDSLATVLETTQTALKIESEKKVKNVERTVFPGWMWWLIIAGSIGGWFARSKVYSITQKNKS